jgi:hypothetical protein
LVFRGLWILFRAGNTQSPELPLRTQLPHGSRLSHFSFRARQDVQLSGGFF